MKILIVNTAGLGMGGITTHIISFLELINEDFSQIDVIQTVVENELMINKFEALGANIIRFPHRKKKVFKYLRKLYKQLNTEKYDIVHIHGNSSTMIFESLISRVCNVKCIVVHAHNTVCEHPFLNYIMKPVFQKTYTDAFACSKCAGDWLFGDSKYKLLHNAFDIQKFLFDDTNRKRVRQELGINDKKVIGHIGVFNQQKNQEFILDIAKELDENYIVVFIGEGETQENVKKKAKLLGISNRILFLNIRKDIPQLLSAMDMFLFPSRWEGLGIVLIEAQLSGLPCIVSDAVPNEVDVSDNVVFLGLNEPINNWKKAIYEVNDCADRHVSIDLFSDYDVTKEVSVLKSVYGF